jgi:hypothetical protein
MPPICRTHERSPVTTRLHITSEAAGGYRVRREAPSLAAAVNHLLDPVTTYPGWSPDRSPGRVAVVRGFDRDSRALRDAVRGAAARRGWPVLDLPAVPAFGGIPVADDVGLVVAVRPLLVPVAERCAAFWSCLMLDPVAASAGVHRANWQSRSALTVTTSRGQYDTVASRFELSGPSRYRGEGKPAMGASAIAVAPHSTGVLVERIAEGDTRTLRAVDTSLTIHLEEPTRGTIDGYPQLFPAGEYTMTALPQRYYRIAT